MYWLGPGIGSRVPSKIVPFELRGETKPGGINAMLFKVVIFSGSRHTRRRSGRLKAFNGIWKSDLDGFFLKLLISFCIEGYFLVSAISFAGRQVRVKPSWTKYDMMGGPAKDHSQIVPSVCGHHFPGVRACRTPACLCAICSHHR